MAHCALGRRGVGTEYGQGLCAESILRGEGGRTRLRLETRESDEFDYGYALTVHKAQGSQWDNVMLFDESFAFRENGRVALHRHPGRREGHGGHIKGGTPVDISIVVLLDLALQREPAVHFPSDEGSARLRPGLARLFWPLTFVRPHGRVDGSPSFWGRSFFPILPPAASTGGFNIANLVSTALVKSV